MADIISLSQVTPADLRAALAWFANEVNTARSQYQNNFNSYRFNANSQSNAQRQATVAALADQNQKLQQLEDWLQLAQSSAQAYGLNGLGVAPLAAAGILVIVALLIGVTTAAVIGALAAYKAASALAQQQANIKDLNNAIVTFGAQAVQQILQDPTLTQEQKAARIQQIQSGTADAVKKNSNPDAPPQPNSIPWALVALGGFALVAYFATFE